jgi:putative membrane protein
MIDYDPHHWRSHLFDLDGSLAREIFPRVAVLTFWAAAVTAFNLHSGYDWSFKPTVHSLVGVALGLLLVFRTNSSYDRFWEGRKLWGGIVNETRNFARQICAHLPRPDVRPQRDALVLHTIGFAYAGMYSLRKGSARWRRAGEPTSDAATAHDMLGPLAKSLSAAELGALTNVDHLPVEMARRMTSLLCAARDQGQLSDITLTHVDESIQLLVDYIGGCERINKTPIPYAYMVHVRRALILYCGSLPFALTQEFGWATVAVTFLLAYIFLGIEEIGVEIENPFGEDENDLPLEAICETIERNLLALIGAGPTPVAVDGE